MSRPSDNPIIGITADVTEKDGRVKLDVAQAYCDAVERAGGVPFVLPPNVALVDEYFSLCNGFVFTGGADPRTEPFGVPTHPKANPMHPLRQEFETKLLAQLQSVSQAPVLGVCLGMQMMCLAAGGKLNQHMADNVPSHAEHWAAEHAVVPSDRQTRFQYSGIVHSRHRQAVENSGRLAPLAKSADGILEGVFDPSKRFYIGVQWHPERTRDPEVGQRLFDELVEAARRNN
ncbi:MAG: gamma-glutamyl-gamma-aminobutyrate hydrolase family protein [Phycisphaerales bacterium]